MIVNNGVVCDAFNAISPFCCVLSIYNITSSGKFREKGTLHDQAATNVLITE